MTYFISNPYPVIEKHITRGSIPNCQHKTQKIVRSRSWREERCILCGWSVVTTKRFR